METASHIGRGHQRQYPIIRPDGVGAKALAQIRIQIHFIHKSSSKKSIFQHGIGHIGNEHVPRCVGNGKGTLAAITAA